MRRIILSISFIFIFGLISNQAFSQAKGFGLGIVVGEPTGISFKSWTSAKGAVDGAVAWSVNQDYFRVHVDYLVHNFNIIDVNQGQLPLYLGIGAKVVFANNPGFGARIPLGINYIFGDAPLDLFAEIVPGLDFVPSTDFFIEGGIGIRYWFQ